MGTLKTKYARTTRRTADKKTTTKRTCLQLEKKLEIRVQVGLNRNSPLLFSSQNLLEQSKEFSLVSNLSLKN